MAALEALVVDVLKETGLEHVTIKTRLGLELPGYYRPEKKWDLIVVSLSPCNLPKSLPQAVEHGFQKSRSSSRSLPGHSQRDGYTLAK